MCLTLCRQRALIYDSDRGIVCDVCPLAEKKDPQANCQQCAHFYAEKKLCLLTSMGIPTTNWCCHFNAPSKLTYFPRNLRNDAEGIVLVPAADFAEAMQDYIYSNPGLMLRLGLPGSVKTIPSGEEKEQNFQDFDWDLFDGQVIQNSDSETKLSENEAEILSVDEIPEEKGYLIISPTQAQQTCYVPIIVGDELVKVHHGVQGLVEWFEAFFGGKNDIFVDWKGRWVVKSHRFAIPGVYGIIAEEWSALLGDEDLTDLLHELFS